MEGGTGVGGRECADALAEEGAAGYDGGEDEEGRAAEEELCGVWDEGFFGGLDSLLSLWFL